MPQKRRHRRPLQEGLSRRRLDEDGASLSESLVDSDSSSRVDGGSPPRGLPDDELLMSSTEPRYHQIIASRLAQLQLPDGADGSDLDGCSNLPSSEILEALLPKSFHDDDLRAALLEYQCQNLLSEIRGPDFMGLDAEDSGDPEPDDLTRDEKYTRVREVLVARMPDIDTYTRLDQEQTNKVYFKHALYRIRAALLLKGKPFDELDDAALERKYPAELIVEKDCFNHYVTDGYFGWDFDSDLLGHKKYLTDYQRLVLLNGDHAFEKEGVDEGEACLQIE